MNHAYRLRYVRNDALLLLTGMGRVDTIQGCLADAMAAKRQAVGDYLAETEQTTPQSVVQFATYQDMVGSMNDVLER